MFKWCKLRSGAMNEKKHTYNWPMLKGGKVDEK